jgi:short-subunit dehydrogenase
VVVHRGGIASGSVLLLGGRSEIGLDTTIRLAAGRVVCLAARRSHDLTEEIGNVLKAGATAVHAIEFDADNTTSHQALLESTFADHGPIGIVVIAFGVLGDQHLAEQDPDHAIGIAHTDYVAQINVLTIAANLLRAQGSGQIVVFSSIAGIRVRRANYVYGSAKAGLDGFAGGLADALYGSGVQLLLVRAGFVVGRMTAGMTPVPLLSTTPEQVSSAVVNGLATRASRVWVPSLLRPAAAVMRLVPRSMWRHMPR